MLILAKIMNTWFRASLSTFWCFARISVTASGVWYTENNHQSFCTLSSNLNHDSSAIAAHMKPIFEKILQNHPKIQILHMPSDGPTTQYRSKNFFWLLVKYILKNLKQIETIVYSYSESGHSKGPCDGVGALTKRTADAAVANGKYVHDLSELLDVLNKSNLNCWFDTVTEDDMIMLSDQLELSKITTFKGTLKVHQ